MILGLGRQFDCCDVERPLWMAADVRNSQIKWKCLRNHKNLLFGLLAVGQANFSCSLDGLMVILH